MKPAIRHPFAQSGRLALLLAVAVQPLTPEVARAQGVRSPQLPAAARMVAPAESGETDESQMYFRDKSGEMIPLETLLGQGFVDELLTRALEQRNVPRYTIDRLELRGEVSRDEVQLSMELQVKIIPKLEWVTIPITPGDVFLTDFSSSTPSSDGHAVLTSGDQNSRQWHVLGEGSHTLRMSFVGKSRSVSPGISQMTLNLPKSTSAHAVLTFASPVELQKIPVGAVHKTKASDGTLQGINEAEFWLADNFSVTWSDVVAPVAQKSVIQSQSKMKLDLTTIPVTLSGTQNLLITGSAINEFEVSFPSGFQLLELDARNANGTSILRPFRIPPSTPEGLTLPVYLTSAVEGQVTLSFELELLNRQFPQDIRIVSPVVKDANFQPGDLDLLFPTGLLVQQTEVKDSQRIRVTSDAKEADLSISATAFRMRSPDSKIVLHVEETEALIALSPEVTLTPQDANVVMAVRYPISVLTGSLLDATIDWPGWSNGDWQILPKSVRLVTDKSQVPLSVQPSESEQDVFKLVFPERQSGKFQVEFEAVAALDKVKSGVTKLQCPELRSKKGQPFVFITRESDLFSIHPVSMGTGETLRSIPSAPAADTVADETQLRSETWLHDAPTIPVRLELREQFPSVQADIVMGLSPKENGIEVLETIRFSIEHRDIAELSLQVPEGIRPTVRIPGQTESLRGTLESSNWRFRLPETRRGSLSLEVFYLCPVPALEEENQNQEIPVPVILPLFEDSGKAVRSIVVGTRSLSGLKVNQDAPWRPVFSEEFELAWASEQAATSVPVRWDDRRQFEITQRPDLLLVRTQIAGRFAVTSTIVVCNTVPEYIVIETPVDVDVEDITIGSASLTTPGTASRERIRQRKLQEDQRVRWQIQTRGLNEPSSGDPLILSVRTREPLRNISALWDTRTFRRAVVLGESSATPVLWCIGSQNEFRVTSTEQNYSCLTHHSATILPGGESAEGVADRQIKAVLSSYPLSIQSLLTPLTEDWLSQTGRQDVFFGSAATSELPLTLLPGVSLLLVSAAVCVFLFVLMSYVRLISAVVPVLFVVCASLVAWLIWPDWTLILAPYILIGVLIGIVSMTLQRYMSDRRIRFASPLRSEDLPTVFGFTGMLAPPIDNHLETAIAESPIESEFSTSSSR